MEAMEILLKRFISLNEEKLWLEFFRDFQNQRFIIEDLIQENQLQKGIDGTGGRITDNEGNDSYSFLTEWITRGRKQEGDPYTLKDTGEFYDSMVIKVYSSEIDIDADPIKPDANLFEKYGDDIIGLTDQNKDRLIQRFRQFAINRTRQLLLGY
jgi:hypothetical protein